MSRTAPTSITAAIDARREAQRAFAVAMRCGTPKDREHARRKLARARLAERFARVAEPASDLSRVAEGLA